MYVADLRHASLLIDDKVVLTHTSKPNTPRVSVVWFSVWGVRFGVWDFGVSSLGSKV